MSDQEEVRGCLILKELHYAVKDHTWVKLNDDDTVTIGMTDVAQNLAGPVLHARVKKAGSVRKKGKPVGTVESSKWVGPVKTPLSGEILEVNENLKDDPQLLNRSPYNKGWIVKLRPADLDAELAEMVTGDDAVEAYRVKIENDDIKGCEHIEGFEG